MNTYKSAVGFLLAGSAVIVELVGAASDVFLVDDVNLRKLERGESYKYYGGHATRSPVRLGVPSNGTWNVVVIPGGSVRVSTRVLRAA
jgi:hypothetical protein